MSDRQDQPRSLARRARPWAVLAFVVATGCSDDNPSLLPIDSVVELRISENSGRLMIQGATQRQYGCLDYRIVHRDFNASSVLQPRLQIEMLGVTAPATCATALAPARSTSSFLMPPIGTHPVIVTANGVGAAATLEVTSDSLIVTGGNGPWTLWPEPRVSRE
jgi:hypothetical protein